MLEKAACPIFPSGCIVASQLAAQQARVSMTQRNKDASQVVAAARSRMSLRTAAGPEKDPGTCPANFRQCRNPKRPDQSPQRGQRFLSCGASDRQRSRPVMHPVGRQGMLGRRRRGISRPVRALAII